MLILRVIINYLRISHLQSDIFNDKIFSISLSIKTRNRTYKNGKYSDFTIKVQDKKYKVHKNILASLNPVSEQMFTDNVESISKTFDNMRNFSEGAIEECFSLLLHQKLSKRRKCRCTAGFCFRVRCSRFQVAVREDIASFQGFGADFWLRLLKLKKKPRCRSRSAPGKINISGAGALRKIKKKLFLSDRYQNLKNLSYLRTLDTIKSQKSLESHSYSYENDIFGQLVSHMTDTTSWLDHIKQAGSMHSNFLVTALLVITCLLTEVTSERLFLLLDY